MSSFLLSYADGVVTALIAGNLKDAKREAEQRVEACHAFAGGNQANIVDQDTYRVVAHVAHFDGKSVAYEPAQSRA